MKITEVMKILSSKKVYTEIKYDVDMEQMYLDLQTNAKSHLYLYEDGVLRGRYGYESNFDLSQDNEGIIYDLCIEFRKSLYGRDYYQPAWGDLCKSEKIELDI